MQQQRRSIAQPMTSSSGSCRSCQSPK